MFRRSALAALCLTALVSGAWTLRGAAQQPGSAPSAGDLVPSLHARTPRRLIIRNAMVIYGNARPPYGPVDVIVENGIISYGTDVMVVNGKTVSNETAVGANDHVDVIRGSGIEWTSKDGIPYHVPTLMREVKALVAQARTATP